MKITRYLTIAAMCILSAASCTKEITGPGLNNGPVEMVLEAYPGEEEPGTKTVLGSDGKSVLWEAEDQISLFFGNGENGGSCFTTADGGETASFTGSINAFTAGGEGYTGETTYFWGVYPYKSTTTCDNNSITINIPSVQLGRAGSFAPGVNISVGRSENLKMGFYNVCSGFNFTVGTEGITELVLKSTDGTPIVGDATVEFVSGKPAVVKLENGTDEVRIFPEDEEFVVGKKYYLEFIPVVLNGITITLYNSKNMEATYENTAVLDFKRGIFKSITGVEGRVGEWTVRKGNISFADPNFKAYCVQNFDTNGDGEVSYAEAAVVDSIDCSSKAITSMDEIKYFTALTSLLCGNNHLTSLDVSKNTALRYLYCASNKLTSLDISNSTALEFLHCSSNQLTSLDISNNTVLTTLFCWNNHLTSLDVSKNTALRYLYCASNKLTSLDVSNNTALTALNCYKNRLTSLDLSKNTALEDLHCGDNQLTSLDISKNTALNYLFCESNQLTSLDVSNNTALTNLNCGNNQLTSLDVSNNTDLISLDCSPMNDENGENLLRTLYIYNGQEINGITNDRSSDFIPDETMITDADPGTNEGVGEEELDGSGNVTFADPNFKSYCVQNFDTNGDGEVSYAEAAVVESIVCQSKSITSMDEIKYFTALTTLSCSLNQLTSLDVSKNTALNYLFCESNQLTSLDVSNNTALTSLDCFDNQLTSLDVSNNTALTNLNCGNNQLTSLDISKNTALEYLSCSYNQLTSLDVSKNTALEYLDCSYNHLTSLDVSKNTALTGLDCGSNKLTSLDVSNNTALKNLYCSPMNDENGQNLLQTLYISNGQTIPNITPARNSLCIPDGTTISVK